MPVTLNKSGDAHARALIAAGKVDRTSSWSFAAADGDKLLGDDGNDWAEYAKWFLGEDSSAESETKARFKYPFGKNGKVYRHALTAIRSRASAQGATAIYDAAGALLELVDKKGGKADGRAAPQSGARAEPVRGATETRFADLKPDSYDPKARTAKAVLSVGAPVNRYFGCEVLEISTTAVNLDRLSSCGIPFLDSHNIYGVGNVLGSFQRIWIEGGELLGLIAFDDSPAGRNAEGLVARGTVRGISIGYRVDEWLITDPDGNVIDPETMRLQWDTDYTFTAKRWELFEGSLVSVPADPSAFFRSIESGSDDVLTDAALRRGATRITKRAGDLSVTYEYPEIAAAARASASDQVIERMRRRTAMLARQLALENSLRTLAR